MQAIKRSRGGVLARTQSGPSRSMLPDSEGDCGGGSSTTGVRGARGRLQRTSSAGLPPSGTGGLRRTSSVGLPLGGSSTSARSSSSGSSSSSAAALHRLSGTPLHRSRSASLASSMLASSVPGSPGESEDELVTPEKLAQAAAESSSELAAATPAAAAGKAAGARLSFEDSAGPKPVRSASQQSAGASPKGANGDPWQRRPASPTSLADLSVAHSSGSIAASAAEQSTPQSSAPLSASPYIPSSCHTLSLGSAAGADLAGASPSLPQQSSFSQPYYAEFEGEAEADARAAAAAGLVTPQAASAGDSMSAGRCRSDSGCTRAAQLLAGQEQMTAEELHEVRAC